MQIADILTLIGGLSLFLLGMNLMSSGLEAAAGNKMKGILEKLTSNRFVGVLVGMIITAVIQSSSATTVMVVGFVNAGMMTLTQAVWVIMGANIGTTITGQLIALDISWIAPIFAFAGVIMLVFVKKNFVNEIGKILLGFGVLFIGMDMMSTSMMPLRDSEAFVNIMTKFSNPFLGILAGTVFTAIIQSSSASVGILQALAISGAIQFESAVYVLFGQNIGTCITALLASIGTNRNAKQTTVIHLTFNIIGTIIFTILCVATPFDQWIKSLSTNPASQIANMHTIFNIATTIILLPFGKYLVKFAELILPNKKEKKDSLFMYLDNDIDMHIGGSAMHLQNTRKEIFRMYDIAKTNVIESFNMLLGQSNIDFAKLELNEDLVDKLNEGITKQISNSLAHETNVVVSSNYSSYLYMTTNIERISDHAMNLGEDAVELKNKFIEFKPEVKNEIQNMKDICLKMLDAIINDEDMNIIQDYEDKIDDMSEEYKINMTNRLQASICTADGAMIYSCILIDFERIGDHLLNIAQQLKKIQM